MAQEKVSFSDSFQNRITNPGSVFLARQPILTSKSSIMGYELLFRGKGGAFNFAEIENEVHATSRVLINALHSVGLSKILGNKKGFVNFNEEILMHGIHDLLDRDRFVIEILENTRITPPLVQLIKKLHSEGYHFALDDFQLSDAMFERYRDLFDMVDTIKVDLARNTLDDLRTKLDFFHQRGIDLLAEKVETPEQFQECKNLGFQFFQGYYFSKPEIVSGRSMDPTVTAVMELVRVLHSGADTKDIVQAFSQYPDIVISLLRFINSATFGLRSEIRSIQHLITLMGRDNLRQWLTMLVYAKPGIPARNSPILVHATQRAKTMEFLARRAPQLKVDEQTAFLTGIISQMDVILQMPMKDVLEEFRFPPEINNAVLRQEGKLGKMLALVALAQEISLFEQEQVFMQELALDHSILGAAVMDSYHWVESNF